MVKAIKKRMRRGTELTALALATLGLFVLAGRQVVASETRTVPVTINAGEAYTIGDVSLDSTPGVKVVSNPSALVVHTDSPGKIVLQGAAAGSWNIDVTLASGEKVTYAVDVKPEESIKGPLASASSPASPKASAPAAAAPSPVTASHPADSGTGPVDAAAAVTAASAPAHTSTAPVAAATAPSALLLLPSL